MPAGERVLEFSEGQAHLCVRYEQLVIRREGLPDTSMPLVEVGVAVFASRQTTCTLSVLDGLVRAGAAVVVCDEHMLPSGMLLPVSANTLQTQSMLAQAAAPKPVNKQLWRQVVAAKIKSQGALLAQIRGSDMGFAAMAARVRSGDPENLEGQAAQRYWPLLFDDPDFRRTRFAPDQNRMLNYGYAILRAAVARAICAAGLHPSLGVHHHGRENPFCLADDLMEPYRPLVDAEVCRLVGALGADAALTPVVKQQLVAVMHARLPDSGESRTVFDWIGRSAASLARCLRREDDRVFFPRGLVEP